MNTDRPRGVLWGDSGVSMRDYDQSGRPCKGCGKKCFSKTQYCQTCKPQKHINAHRDKYNKLGMVPHLRKCTRCPVLFLVSVEEQARKVWKCPECRQKQQFSKAS